jgi:hypothetical protein
MGTHMQISYDEKLKNCPFKSNGTKAGPAQLLMNKIFHATQAWHADSLINNKRFNGKRSRYRSVENLAQKAAWQM